MDYESGLHRIVENNFDVCLLDYNIGGRNGVDLANEAKRQGCYNPIILFSGLDVKEMQKLAYSNNLEGFLSKNELSTENIILEMQNALVNQQINNLYPFEDGTIHKLDQGNISTFILENLPDPIIALDHVGKVSVVNSVFANLMSLGCEDLLGTHASLFLNCSKQELDEIIAEKKDSSLRTEIKKMKSSGPSKSYILWHISFVEDERIAMIARGSIGRRSKKKAGLLPKILRVFPRIVSNPSYVKGGNGLYFRRDIFE